MVIRERSGKITNISSVVSIGEVPNAAAYSAAKVGVIGMVRSIEQEGVPLVIIKLLDTMEKAC
jgi:NAD(P)-dependent dehydrogenase (short-subunit alcohol dehydrogenase family)